MPKIEEPPKIQEVGEVFRWIFGAPVNGYVERQIQFSVEWYIRKNPSEDISWTERKLDLVMEAWSDSIYSKVIGEIKTSPEFKTHARIQGNYANLTLDDLDYFSENQKLPSL